MSMTLIEHIEVGGGGAASILFDNIPQTYTDLYFVASIRTNRGQAIEGMILKPNSSATLPTVRYLLGTGSSVISDTVTSLGAGAANGASSTGATYANTGVYIPNYTSSVAKSLSVDSVLENNATLGYQNLVAGLWNVTDAITSLLIVGETGGTIQASSSATLYGITAGSDGTTTVS